jgi:hypothetical protein
MSSVYYPKPRCTERWTGKPKEPNQFCKKVSYRHGSAYECSEPTEGKTYCPSCARKLLTLTDRSPLPDQPAPQPFHWASDQIFPRKRA